MGPRRIRDMYVLFYCSYDKDGQYVSGFQINDKIGLGEKVLGIIPYEEIGSWDRYKTMDDQELEKLVDKYLTHKEKKYEEYDYDYDLWDSKWGYDPDDEWSDPSYSNSYKPWIYGKNNIKN